MKRSYLFLVCTILCELLSAENVTLKQAQDFALAFFRQHIESRNVTSPQLQMVWDGEDTQSRSHSSPAFYVFNRTDQPGFVIVAGDDIASPVLGYSLDNGFKATNMPDNIRYWLLGIREEINEARKEQFQPASRTSQAWDSRAAEIGQVVLEVPSAKWDQTEYYNELCPVIDGRRAVTGCTATAMAIVLKSRQWPDKGEGTIPTYSYQWNGNTYNIPSQELGHTYDWNLMPDKLTNNSTTEQKEQVATLMRDCGYMSKSEYTSYETGADCSNSHKALIQFMKYSPNTIHGFNNMFSKEEWHRLIREEMQENGPVFYTCNWNDGSGHAFVLDGYTTADFYRVNWGWSGYSDGYYLLSALNADGQGFASDMNDRSRIQTAFLGLKKKVENEIVKGKLVLEESSYASYFFNGITPNTIQIQKNVEFTARIGMITCISSTFTGRCMVSLFSKDGTFKEDVLSKALEISSMRQNNWQGYSNVVCKITQDIESGDYLAIRYQNSGSEEWEIMTGGESVIDKLTIDNDGTYTGELRLTKETGRCVGFWFDEEVNFVPHNPFNISVIGYINNESQDDFTGYITISIFDKDNQWKEDILQEPYIIYGLPQNKHFALLNVNVTITKDILEGDYLAVCYRHKNSTEWKRLCGKDDTIDRIILKQDLSQVEKLIYLQPGNTSEHNYIGLETNVEQIKENMDFTVYAGLMSTVPNKYFNGYIGICLFDIDGKSKGKINTNNVSLTGQGTLFEYGMTFSCRIEQYIEPGDYIALAYKQSSYPVWVEADCRDGAIGRIVLKEIESLIAGSTQFTYNRISKVIKIRTLSGVSYQVTDENGNNIMSGTLTDTDNFSIATSDMQAGIYHLVIENEESQMKTSFVIGQKESSTK